MNKLNSKELRIKIEELYLNSLGTSEPEHIVILDAIKSILGMDLENINLKLLNLFIEGSEKFKISHDSLEKYENIPEAISLYSLEKSLLDRDCDASIESAYYLSRVSDGMQVLEFLLEFSLKYCQNSYRYIWHIIRIQKFLNGKYMLESLNKSIYLILSEDFVNSFEIDHREVFWSSYLPLKFDEEDDFLLYYTIYKSDLIRGNTINGLIASRLLEGTVKKKEVALKVYDDQLKIGRHWILDYINNAEDEKIDFEVVTLLDNIRSCLMLSNSELEKKYLWTYLYNKLCN